MFNRFYQFFLALNPIITSEDEKFVVNYLSASELIFFNKLPKSDRRHAIKVAYYLVDSFPNDVNLIKAGLLHDIGKTIRPLSIIEKSLAVLLSILFPFFIKRLASKKASFLHIYLHHADIGFDIAQNLKLDNDILFLIKNHHIKDIADQRLQALISADNAN
jgi:putative nucleotidyltransferase with HDIG domain